jgi:hypothetical protein
MPDFRFQMPDARCQVEDVPRIGDLESGMRIGDLESEIWHLESGIPLEWLVVNLQNKQRSGSDESG